jgi:hypothetical protein
MCHHMFPLKYPNKYLPDTFSVSLQPAQLFVCHAPNSSPRVKQVNRSISTFLLCRDWDALLKMSCDPVYRRFARISVQYQSIVCGSYLWLTKTKQRGNVKYRINESFVRWENHRTLSGGLFIATIDYRTVNGYIIHPYESCFAEDTNHSKPV